jgi:cyclase
MGDTFFNKLYPFIDTASGGTVDGVIAAADRVLALANDTTKLIPGHGPLASKADLKVYREMLAMVSARIRREIKLGKTVEEVAATKPTEEFDEVWGKAFITPARFIEMVYKNLQR